MDSPVPAIVALLLVGGTAYQLMFRYDHWTGGKNNEVSFERDNLTGEVHQVRPGEKVDFISRLLGDHSVTRRKLGHSAPEDEREERLSDAGGEEEALGMLSIEEPARKVAKTQQAIPVSKEVAKGDAEYARQEGDFNGDGKTEEVIQSKTANDGLLDISVVSNGREIFYGRGKRLIILPTRHAGWADLALKTDGANAERDKLVFRYDPTVEGYEIVDGE